MTTMRCAISSKLLSRGTPEWPSTPGECSRILSFGRKLSSSQQSRTNQGSGTGRSEGSLPPSGISLLIAGLTLRRICMKREMPLTLTEMNGSQRNKNLGCHSQTFLTLLMEIFRCLKVQLFISISRISGLLL